MRIWIVNLLLSIVTLSLYLPFAKARRLAYFRGNTQIDGHALGFHANPWKMLRASGIWPAVMLVFFERVRQLPERKGHVALPIALASHPADDERKRFFGGEPQTQPN